MNDDKKQIRQNFWRAAFALDQLQTEAGVKRASEIILDAVRSGNQSFLDTLPDRVKVLEKTYLEILHGVEKIKSSEMLDCLESIGIDRQLLLSTAVVQSRHDVARYLLSENKVKLHQEGGRLLYEAACDTQDLEMVKILMQGGLDLDRAVDRYSGCPLYDIIDQGTTPEIIREILDWDDRKRVAYEPEYLDCLARREQIRSMGQTVISYILEKEPFAFQEAIMRETLGRCIKEAIRDRNIKFITYLAEEDLFDMNLFAWDFFHAAAVVEDDHMMSAGVRFTTNQNHDLDLGPNPLLSKALSCAVKANWSDWIGKLARMGARFANGDDEILLYSQKEAVLKSASLTDPKSSIFENLIEKHINDHGFCRQMIGKGADPLTPLLRWVQLPFTTNKDFRAEIESIVKAEAQTLFNEMFDLKTVTLNDLKKSMDHPYIRNGLALAARTGEFDKIVKQAARNDKSQSLWTCNVDSCMMIIGAKKIFGSRGVDAITTLQAFGDVDHLFQAEIWHNSSDMQEIYTKKLYKDEKEDIDLDQVINNATRHEISKTNGGMKFALKKSKPS